MLSTKFVNVDYDRSHCLLYMLVKEASKESGGEWGTQRRKEESVQKRAVSIPDNTGADLLTSPFAPRKKKRNRREEGEGRKTEEKTNSGKNKGIKCFTYCLSFIIR